MRDPARIPRICSMLMELWEKHPDMRFHQLLIVAGITPDGMHWFTEDDKIEAQLDRVLAEGFS